MLAVLKKHLDRLGERLGQTQPYADIPLMPPRTSRNFASIEPKSAWRMCNTAWDFGRRGKIKTLCVGALVALAALGTLPGEGLAKPLFRISTENAKTHVQTRIVANFAQRLREKLGDDFDIQHFSQAELFRDRDVVNALEEGKVEMAVLGTWQLGKFEPSFGLFLLPMFYGRDVQVNYRLRDGKIGQDISRRLENKTGVKVLGRWINLGYAHLYSLNKPLKKHEDIAGLRIRAAGGPANLERLAALGAEPVVIPWPDLPLALQQGEVDGVLTSHASVVSADLWASGIQYAFEDRQYFPQYVPLVSHLFWQRLSVEQQQILQQCWEQGVDEARSAARSAQEQARKDLIGHGVRVTAPSEQELSLWRDRIMEKQDDLVTLLGIDLNLVRQARDMLMQ